ncbi:hypothetical protein Tco_0678709 [Tanacetum coccineum]|uniref:Uncharacterized protein n=1 Tax=Tanacetum coccineum TaxID=301880 RepID=A0ABQ4XGG9_9ASTR
MEEYIRLEEEKAQKRGKVLTETASMVVGYTEEIVHDFEQRLEMIFGMLRAPLFPEFIRDLKHFRIGDAMRLDVAGLHTAEEMAEDRFGPYWLGSERVIPDKGDLKAVPQHGLRGSQRSYLLARYLKLFASRRKHGAMIYGGQFVARLVKHFGLLTEERLKGGFTEEALVAPGGGDEDEEMPQTGQREVLDSMASDFSRFTTWTVTSLARLMDRAGVPYTRYSEPLVEYQRCTRQRTDGANTSTAPQ